MTVLDLLPADLGPGGGGFTTRAGGVSWGRYGSADGTGGLNLGLHVDDDVDRVLANRDLLDRWAGGRVAWMSQGHGRSVRVVARPPGAGRTTMGAHDSLVGSSPAGPAGVVPVAVAVMVADCVPLLLATPDGGLVAAVHVGRQGLVAGVVGATLERLADAGAALPRLYASLGPSICGHCYEVPAELRAEVAAVVPAAHATTSWQTPALDVAAGVRGQLAAAGVRRVEQHAACTYEDPALYSYRRDGVTGRFAGIVQRRR
ncbi:polyphenol oxidase family protein [Georgenia sp. MJ173]|uniref:polyphenol oxidase family protein n=1 Tax=Georgenia sunbinii TaxID=3117728 RepID=UPI002F262275